jgi:GT2 family glycosyltransferase
MRKISIIIPVIRADSAKRCIDAIRRCAGVDADQYEIVTDEDVHGVGCPEMVRMLTALTTHDLVLFLGDDTEPESDFLAAALDAMGELPDGWGVVGLNTQGENDHAHWLADKRMLDHIPGGCFFSTDYEHCYGDDELKDIAIEHGRWGFAENSTVIHHHPINDTAEYDDGYNYAYDRKRWERDRQTYQRRKNERMRANGVRHFGVAWPITNLILFSDFALSWEMLEKPNPYSFFYPQIANQMDTANPGGSHNANLDVIRNELVDQALMAGVTDLLFADTDQIYMTPDMISRMLAHNAPIVVARVHRRYPPFDPIMLISQGDDGYRAMDFGASMDAIESGATVEVDASGFGCVLVKTEVFCAIDYPWFKFGKRKNGDTIGEDVSFYEAAKAAGYGLLMDTSIDIRHSMTKGIGVQDYMLFQKLNRSGGVKQNGRGK